MLQSRERSHTMIAQTPGSRSSCTEDWVSSLGWMKELSTGIGGEGLCGGGLGGELFIQDKMIDE